ncbi:hypothetical protein [Maribacter polysaccharolyticus]|uniref:hypothetical protein n=1 Tax=Maribacter polysaccharolyticus TaxID=3020831 RepID=UPI00237F7B11|nr:hypothetical protein [Maribacter polysaccharolyticus]MDE3743179.1 hypothetical protein [Maribacter polysaccharolyticus]
MEKVCIDLKLDRKSPVLLYTGIEKITRSMVVQEEHQSRRFFSLMAGIGGEGNTNPPLYELLGAEQETIVAFPIAQRGCNLEDRPVAFHITYDFTYDIELKRIS